MLIKTLVLLGFGLLIGIRAWLNDTKKVIDYISAIELYAHLLKRCENEEVAEEKFFSTIKVIYYTKSEFPFMSVGFNLGKLKSRLFQHAIATGRLIYNIDKTIKEGFYRVWGNYQKRFCLNITEVAIPKQLPQNILIKEKNRE